MINDGLKPDEAALLQDPSVLRKAFHLLGRNYFHQSNRKGPQGLGILRMIFLGGEVEAGVDAAAAEVLVGELKATSERSLAPGSLHSPRIYDFLKKTALSKSDWRAMILYLNEMSRLQTSEASVRDHYELAKELYMMLEPSKQLRMEDPYILQQYESPWKILFDAARKYLTYLPDGAECDEVQATLEVALHEGIHSYSDPRAIAPALHESNVIARHSPQWLELATQSAASGDSAGAFELAIYHLRNGGWRIKSSEPLQKPTFGLAINHLRNGGWRIKSSKPLRKPNDWTGIEWLAVSASLSAPNATDMTNKYLGLAYLLREHGYPAEGYTWMAYAKENIVEAEVDPHKLAQAKINGHEQSWKEADKDKTLERGKYWKKSNELLEPYLHVEDK